MSINLKKKKKWRFKMGSNYLAPHPQHISQMNQTQKIMNLTSIIINTDLNKINFNILIKFLKDVNDLF